MKRMLAAVVLALCSNVAHSQEVATLMYFHNRIGGLTEFTDVPCNAVWPGKGLTGSVVSMTDSAGVPQGVGCWEFSEPVFIVTTLAHSVVGRYDSSLVTITEAGKRAGWYKKPADGR